MGGGGGGGSLTFYPSILTLNVCCFFYKDEVKQAVEGVLSEPWTTWQSLYRLRGQLLFDEIWQLLMNEVVGLSFS